MSHRPMLFSSAFKRQNFLYYSGVLFSNVLIYLILIRTLQFYIAGALPFEFTTKVLMIQVIVWMILKAIRVREDDNQKLSSNWFVMGGVFGAVIGMAFQILYRLPNLFELGLFAMGHIFFQNVLWSELSTTSPRDKKLMVLRILVIAFFTFLLYLTDFRDPSLLAWCGMMALGHIVLRTMTTGISQIWLIYNEEVLFKSHYHQIVKTHQVQHLASSTSKSMLSSFKNNVVFIFGSVIAGLVAIGLMATSVAQSGYNALANAFVGLLQWVLGDLMKNFFEFLIHAQQQLKPPEQKVAGGVAKKMLKQAIPTSQMAQKEQALDFLTVLFGVIVVGIIMLALFAMAKTQVKRIRRQMLTNKDVGRSHFEHNGFFKGLAKVFDVKSRMKAGQLDLYRRKYKKLLEGFKSMGMVFERSDTPSELVEKMVCYLPGERDRLICITEVYNALRYGEVHAPMYEQAMTELNLLIKQVKKGVRLYDKKIESGGTH